jgi:hypothetical protein
VKKIEADSLAPCPFSRIHNPVYIIIRVLDALAQKENRFISVVTSNTDPALPRQFHYSLAYVRKYNLARTNVLIY